MEMTRREIEPFTLLEVLLTSAIIGIFLSVALAGFSENMRTAKLASDTENATRFANSLLVSTLSDPKLAEGSNSGEGFAGGSKLPWRSSVRSLGQGSLLAVDVEVSFGAGSSMRTVRLRSLTFTPPPPGKQDPGASAAPSSSPAN